MSLVVFTTFVGLVAAPGHDQSADGHHRSLQAIAVGAGAAGALNMWYDADIDILMARTASRPIPQGRIEPRQALAFGLVLAVLSVLTLGVLVNWLSAAMLAFTIFFYAVIYTMWLKRLTPQNIVIGGAAGAFPPMIGWAAAMGSISVESFLLFLIIFLWTPPHFWALALYKSGEYGRAGIPMMPNVAGPASTRRHLHLCADRCAGRRPALRARLCRRALRRRCGRARHRLRHRLGERSCRAPRRPAMKAEKSLFGFSILYLFGIFAAYLADAVLQRALVPIGG